MRGGRRATAYVFTQLLGYPRATRSTDLVVSVGDKPYFDRFRAAESRHFAEVATVGRYTLYQIVSP